MRRIIFLVALTGLTLPAFSQPRGTDADPEPGYTIDSRYRPTDAPATPDAVRKRFDPWQSRHEITAAVGLYTPFQGEAGGAEECFRIDYSSFGYNQVGFRAGILYTPQLRGLDHAFGLPIHIVWRSSLRGRERRAERWPDAAVSTIENRGNPLPGLLLILLPQRIEFGGGVTPGWIFGRRTIHYSWRPGQNNDEWQETGILRHHPFTLTLDAEMKLTYRIWRFTLSLSPGVHYSLTDNFRTWSSASDQQTDPGRWYFSFTGGLGFLF